MSMDLYVFVDHSSTLTVLEWQKAIDASHFPLRLDKNIDLRKWSGFFPIMLKNKKTGFYFLNTDSAVLGTISVQVQQFPQCWAISGHVGVHQLGVNSRESTTVPSSKVKPSRQRGRRSLKPGVSAAT